MAEAGDDTGHQTERGYDRFVNFSDAVVAIAISLLILPVVDAVQSPRTTAEFLRTNGDRLFAFALSFVVIAGFWVAHHRLFEDVKAYSKPLLSVNLVWLATIVFLPLPTEILAVVGRDDWVTRLVYIGAVLAVSLAAVALELVTDHTPAIRRYPDVPPPSVASRLATPALILVAMVVATAVPAIGMWAMLLLVLSGRVANALSR